MITLPKEKSKIDKKMKSQKTLIYGRPKIGKTTFANEYEGNIFFATESGHKHLECYKIEIRSWVDFLYACKAMRDEKHEYKTITIDTGDNLVKYLSDYICEKLSIEDLSSYKKMGAWHIATAELHDKITKLVDFGYAVNILCHMNNVKIEGRGKPYDRADISVSGKNGKVLTGIVDHILYIDSEWDGADEVRFIRTRASKYWNAGSRNRALEGAAKIPLDYKTLKSYFTM